MQRFSRLSILCLGAAVAMSACNPEELIPTENIPTGGVRFINAVPDSAGSFGLDFRFLDIVESNAHFRISFRNSPTTTAGVIGASSVQYKGARAGNRNFAIFLNDTLQSIASTKLRDSTLTVEDGKNYSVILWGPARAGQMRMRVIPETVADPGTKVALRVINATGDPIDASPYLSSGTAPAVPVWANVPAYSVSSYVLVDPGQYRYTVRAPGTTTPLFADQLALIGAVASSSPGAAPKIDIEPLPGTVVAGSAVTMVVFPRSTVGSKAPQTAAFQVPGGAFMWDRRPPRGF
jgi:hypothetical protein